MKLIETELEKQPHKLGANVWPETTWVDPNEKALLLIERNETAPDYKSLRRYQTLFVKRGDGLAKYMEDMGPAVLYLAAELDVPGGDPSNTAGEWFESVESLRDHANVFREWLAQRRYEREVPDLVGGVYDLMEQEGRMQRRLSQFGSKYAVTRG